MGAKLLTFSGVPVGTDQSLKNLTGVSEAQDVTVIPNTVAGTLTFSGEGPNGTAGDPLVITTELALSTFHSLKGFDPWDLSSIIMNSTTPADTVDIILTVRA